MSSVQGQLEIGAHLGTSPWLQIDQDMISGFGVATRDPDPMHMDPDWSKQHSPYGETISFGFLTIGLLSRLLYGAVGFEPERDMDIDHHFMNYGFDRLRLMSPVPVDSRVRGVFHVKDIQPADSGHERVIFDVIVEVEGNEKPALAAEWVVIHVKVEAIA